MRGKLSLSLETVRGHEALEADLVEAVLELRGLVGGVNVDQDQPRLGRGKLGEVPLVGVGAPDTDPVSRNQPQLQQSGSEAVNLLLNLGERPPDVLVSDHQGLPVTKHVLGPVHGLADGQPHERRISWTTDVTPLGLVVHCGLGRQSHTGAE